MRTALLLSTGISSLAFMAKADPAAKTDTAPATATATTAATAKADRVAPELAAVRTDIPMPSSAPRGSKSQYDFDKLEVGASIGVLNKTASQLSSIVSNQNRKHKVDKTDQNGAKVYKTKVIENQDGTKSTVSTQEVEQVNGKLFKVVDTDPKTDPDGAKARIFRTA